MNFEGKPKIYIIGPYTKPDPATNVRIAIETGDRVLDLGGVPFIPHLSHTWDTQSPKSYDTWMDYCIAWLLACDAAFRLPGVSPGGDVEEARCNQEGIPVFKDLDALRAWIERFNKDRFYQAIKDIKDLHRRKAADYGSHEDPFANYREVEGFGVPAWLYCVCRSAEKLRRIKSFIANGRLVNDSLEETLKDEAVQFINALVLLSEQSHAQRTL